jgi:hypothetical protein
VEGFLSGQRDQTVNLTALPSVVRIHLPPPPLRKPVVNDYGLFVFIIPSSYTIIY